MINPLYKKHIISINNLTLNELNLILSISTKIKDKPQLNILNNKVIASCFFEASTRTRLSFETAIHRLGSSIIGLYDVNNTSMGKKGETLADTISVISNYVDAIIIRHAQEGAASLAAEFSGGIPVLNAGDGANQHPTQTLTDLFTIQETQGRLNNLNIAIVGDLRYGRTVHSLIQALINFSYNRFYFIAPPTLTIPNYILYSLKEKNLFYCKIHDGIEDILPELDILYMTRIQKERLNPKEYVNIKTQFILRTNNLINVRSNFKILHPLPRMEEIDYAVDKTPYAYYFQQAGNGVFTRQALLLLVLNEKILN